jgi:hypothetical protein
MRYQVPQFVDIEDKIVGPLTLRQFLTYVGAVLVLIPLYIIVDLSLFITLMIPVLAIAGMFAHFQLNGKTLFQVIMNGVNFFTRGQLYIWQRKGDDSLLLIQGSEYSAFSPDNAAALLANVEKSRVSSLATQAQQLETTGQIVTEDIDDPITAEPAANSK